MKKYVSLKWIGCFGVMSVISHAFITKIQEKYNKTITREYISNLIK